MITPTFTEQQIKDFLAYEKVRMTGKFNMITNGAVAATGLGDERHMFVARNYRMLKAAASERKSS